MKLLYLLVFPAIVLLLACDKSESPDPISQFPVNSVDKEMIHSIFLMEHESRDMPVVNFDTKAGKAVTKILKIRASGTMTAVPNVPECNGLFKIFVEGEGNATHLGLFTIELSYCSDGVNPTGPIEGVQTAANGDKLYTVVVGADPQANSLDFFYYDGTGRFEGATGFITLFFTFDYVNQTFENYGEGTITY